LSHVLLVGRFDPGDPSSGATLQAFADALDGVTVTTTADSSVAEPLGFAPLHVSRGSVVRAIVHCDVVVVAGGNAFDGTPRLRGRTPALRTALVVALAQACRRPVALIGVGATAIEGHTTRALARFVVRNADLLVLRDESSASALRSAGAVLPLRVAADPVWCALRYAGATTDLRGLVVVVDNATASRSVLEELSGALSLLGSLGVCVQPWRCPDVGAAAALAEMVRAPVRLLPPVPNLDEAMRIFGSADVVVSMCDHATMAAAAAGTASVSLGRSSSLAALAGRLGHDIVDAPIGSRRLADVVERAVGSRPTPAGVRHEQAMAEGSMALLRLLVDRGDVLELAAVDGLTLSDGRSAR
jgi:polysaccharide pyruvyl transferase WcaK-like protein